MQLVHFTNPHKQQQQQQQQISNNNKTEQNRKGTWTVVYGVHDQCKPHTYSSEINHFSIGNKNNNSPDQIDTHLQSQTTQMQPLCGAQPEKNKTDFTEELYLW